MKPAETDVYKRGVIMQKSEEFWTMAHEDY
jgi:hypothetical protein